MFTIVLLLIMVLFTIAFVVITLVLGAVRGELNRIGSDLQALRAIEESREQRDRYGQH